MLEDSGITLDEKNDGGYEISDADARRIREIIREKAHRLEEGKDADYDIKTSWSSLNYEERQQVYRSLDENKITSGIDAVVLVTEYGGNIMPGLNIYLKENDVHDFSASYERYLAEKDD